MSQIIHLARRLSVCLLICIGASAALPLQAAVVVARSDETMTRLSPAILSGTVVETYARLSERGHIETVVRVLIDEAIKGDVVADTIVDVVQYGGQLDGRFQAQSGAPRYEVGSRYLVFLDRDATGKWTTFDLALGQFRFVVQNGKQMLVRDTTEISGWMETGEAFHDAGRTAAAFLARVRELAKDSSGIKAMGKQLQPAPLALDYDLKSVSQGAVGTWAGAESAMNDTVSSTPAGGDTAIPDQPAQNPDCESRLIADDPHSDIAGTFSGAGVVATAFYGCGSPCGSCAQHTKNSESYRAIDLMDVVVNDGVSSSTISSGNFMTTIVHEIGHTWGFRHSNQNADNGACNAPLPCTSSAIMNSSVVGGLNGNLQGWDLDAANEVYGNGTRQAGQTGTQYVGHFDIPYRRPNATAWRIAQTPCTAPSAPVPNGTATITVGQSTPLTVSSPAAGVTYTWFTGSPGDTSNQVGTGSSINVSPSVTTSYWVRASACSPVLTANSATSVTVTVQAPQCVPTTQVTASTNQPNVTPGTTVNIFANANGSNPSPTFQWFTGTPSTGSPINGATSATLQANPQVTTTYYVEARNTCSTGPVPSNPVTITVQPCTAPSNVIVQASPTSIVAGNNATLSFANIGGTAPFTVQWFQGNPPGAFISSSLQPFFVTPAVTTSYYAEVSNACGGPARSNVVTVTVAAQCTPPANAVATGPAAPINAGQTANLAVTADGTGLTFQWFRGTPANPTEILGATSAALPVTPATTTTYFAKVTGQCGTPVNSNVVTVTVTAACTNPAITTQPASQSIIVSATANLSVVTTGTAPLTFQWFKGATGDTSSPVSGATSAAFTTPSLLTKTQYWVRVSGNCPGGQPVFSNTATIDVKAARGGRPVKH